jgi:hypothetical protein
MSLWSVIYVFITPDKLSIKAKRPEHKPEIFCEKEIYKLSIIALTTISDHSSTSRERWLLLMSYFSNFKKGQSLMQSETWVLYSLLAAHIADF